MADNAGSTDEHRALNYSTVRYPAIYTNTAEAFARNASLSAVTVHTSPLSTTRKVVDVIFSYTNRATDVTEKFSVRVDVTEEFPFLVTKMARPCGSLSGSPGRRRAPSRSATRSASSSRALATNPAAPSPEASSRCAPSAEA